MAAQHYFNKAVVADPELHRRMTWVKLIAIDQRLQEGFEFVTLLLERQGQKFDEVLDAQARLADLTEHVHDRVLEMHAEIRGLAQQFNLVHQKLTARHSLSIRDENERRAILDFKRRYRALDEDQRRRHPQLGLDLVGLEIVAGDYREAFTDARQAAGHLDDSGARAEAHHRAYRAALELEEWVGALAELLKAAEANPLYAIWPTHKYQVEGILGAGAFGVALLCHHRFLKDRHVVIKAFEMDGIDRDVAAIFREAHILEDLEHPGIVRLLDCGFADATGEQRPYLELAHFADSLTLEKYVHEHGRLAPDDLLPVAVQTAEALKAAHEAGVLHRDVKPSNLLVRKTASGWQVKVIDFGLSLRRSLIQAPQARAASLGRSMAGSAVAGTLHYGAPEQLDPDRSREVGPHSDVFGFGRTCYFALFHEPYPDQEDLETLPPPWKDLLGRCTAKKIDRRPKDFAAVLDRLKTGQEPSPKAATSEASPFRTLQKELNDAIELVLADAGASGSPADAGDSSDAPGRNALEQVEGPSRFIGFVALIQSLICGAMILAMFDTLMSGYNFETDPRSKIIFYVLMLILHIFNIYSSFRMSKLSEYRLAIAGSFAIILAGWMTFGLGVLAGLWSLWTLRRAEVRSAFERNMDTRRSNS
jgi:serine/threonine-protein kinase